MVVTVGGSCYALGRVLKIVRTSNMDSQGKQTVPRPSARAGSVVGKISLAVIHRREPWPAVCPGSQLGCPRPPWRRPLACSLSASRCGRRRLLEALSLALQTQQGQSSNPGSAPYWLWDLGGKKSHFCIHFFVWKPGT